jgi:hypothetical protein
LAAASFAFASVWFIVHAFVPSLGMWSVK